jgi:hypothetical protein
VETPFLAVVKCFATRGHATTNGFNVFHRTFLNCFGIRLRLIVVAFLGAYDSPFSLALCLPEHAAEKWPQVLGPLAGNGQLTFALVGHLF